MFSELHLKFKKWKEVKSLLRSLVQFCISGAFESRRTWLREEGEELFVISSESVITLLSRMQAKMI